jgi:hypothetical protein
LPAIIENLGEAGQKVVGSAFEHIGAGMSRIDSIHIIDLGGSQNGSGGDPLSKFALNIPKTVFGVVAQAKAMGLDVGAIMEKFGLPKAAMEGLLGSLDTSKPSGNGDLSATDAGGKP